jgi:mannose/fructose/N-acetylgalactosamine-specific phosphotransferase system component IIC
MPKEVLEKLTSGKFWLTIIAGFVFAYATWKRILNAEAVTGIIVMVFISYFQKQVEPSRGETTIQTTEVKTNKEEPAK